MLNRRTMRWIWTAIAVANVIAFAVLEGYALSHKDALTLSRYLWEISQAWPPFGVILGMLWGGLIVHLFWHWMPDKSEKSDGG